MRLAENGESGYTRPIISVKNFTVEKPKKLHRWRKLDLNISSSIHVRILYLDHLCWWSPPPLKGMRCKQVGKYKTIFSWVRVLAHLAQCCLHTPNGSISPRFWAGDQSHSFLQRLPEIEFWTFYSLSGCLMTELWPLSRHFWAFSLRGNFNNPSEQWFSTTHTDFHTHTVVCHE